MSGAGTFLIRPSAAEDLENIEEYLAENASVEVASEFLEAETDIALARSCKAGMVYVTDDVLVPNPWDALATYFEAELSELAP